MVKNKNWNRMWDFFHEASVLTEPDRSTFLDDCCSDDPALRAELDSLLRAADDADEVFESPLHPPGHAASELDALFDDNEDDPKLPSLTGRTIGRFTLGRLLGEGGAGVVYEATRENPRLTLALKLLRTGLVSPEAHRRFHYESRILAHLRHPGIAAIHETGTYDEGTGATPWFALELIPDAKSITDFADDQNLNINERIGLFLQICDAVAYAHQRGVIHRDLKPANVLVNEHGRIKIIDYGIAHATDADLTLTSTPPDPDSPDSPVPADPSSGGLAGTLGYMAPEQTQGAPDVLDHRCDIYALGTLLYRLLTGKPALDLHRVPLLEAISIIRTRPPVHPRVHNSVCHGDLGDIIMTALEKEPDDRYPNVLLLARDLNHYLKSEPLEFHPPTRRRRAILFIRRNKPLVIGLTAASLFLILGTIVSSTQAIRASHAETRAVQRYDDLRTLAQTLIFDLNDAIADLPGSVPARNLLVENGLTFLNRLRTNHPDDPTLLREIADGYERIGDIQGNPFLANLGRFDEARTNYHLALDIRRSLLESDPSNPGLRHELARILFRCGQVTSPDERATEVAAHDSVYYREALSILDELAAQTDDPTVQRDLVETLIYYGLNLRDYGGRARGQPMLQRAVRIARTLHQQSPDAPQFERIYAEASYRLADLLNDLEDTRPRALVYLQSARRHYAALHEIHPLNLFDHSRLLTLQLLIAKEHAQNGDIDQALTLIPKAMHQLNALRVSDPTNQAIFGVFLSASSIAGDTLIILGERTELPLNQRLTHWHAALDRYQATAGALAEHQRKGWLTHFSNHWPALNARIIQICQQEINKLESP